MKKIEFMYGKGTLGYEFEDGELAAVLRSSIEEYHPEITGRELVRHALENPIGSERLCELAKGKQKIVVIASDHTRPVPSKIIMPELLAEIRSKNPAADITILIATGCHRGTTKEELIAKFGTDIVENEKIVIHDCDDKASIKNIGVLPSGGQCEINDLAVSADLLVAEGFIEPHFFAGYSGGRKSVLPGIASRETVMANHCSEFIASDCARTGILEGNPIHKDMVWAARTAGLKFIVNVVLNSEKEPIYAVAGDLEEAHKKGTDFLSGLCGAAAVRSDVAISTNGGYPLDQNIYQAVKGMTAAEATVKEGGVIIMLAASDDGTGGDYFYHQLADAADVKDAMKEILSRKRSETVPDQWEAQVLLRVLIKATVIYVSNLPDETIRNMHMIPAHSIEEALSEARKIVGKEKISITAIPDGISVVVKD